MSNPRRGCPACGHLHTNSEQCDFRPVPEGEHSQADAPPSATGAALSWRKADTAPALPLELAAADALELADSELADVADGTTCFANMAAALDRIAALLRSGLGEDEQ